MVGVGGAEDFESGICEGGVNAAVPPGEYLLRVQLVDGGFSVQGAHRESGNGVGGGWADRDGGAGVGVGGGVLCWELQQ
jgi:hypothetical protein